MSWSINWDSSQNKNTFVNENAEFLAKFKNNEPTTVHQLQHRRQQKRPQQ